MEAEIKELKKENRTNHMEYMEGMEVLESDIQAQVITRMEQYEPEDCLSAADLILQFVQFLKANNLMDTYLEHWQARS